MYLFIRFFFVVESSHTMDFPCLNDNILLKYLMLFQKSFLFVFQFEKSIIYTLCNFLSYITEEEYISILFRSSNSIICLLFRSVLFRFVINVEIARELIGNRSAIAYECKDNHVTRYACFLFF